jgi:hypothetical protein
LGLTLKRKNARYTKNTMAKKSKTTYSQLATSHDRSVLDRFCKMCELCQKYGCHSTKQQTSKEG